MEVKNLKPKNQKQLAIFYLLENSKVNMKFVINDSLFFKFNTRLSEIENTHGVITTKERVKFKNRFNRDSSYLDYSLAISKEKAVKLFNDLE